MAVHNQLGKKGEDMAEAYLLQIGYQVLHRNWRHSHYEIDIIAIKNEVLHFVEVKLRSSKTLAQETLQNLHERLLLRCGKPIQSGRWLRHAFDYRGPKSSSGTREFQYLHTPIRFACMTPDQPPGFETAHQPRSA